MNFMHFLSYPIIIFAHIYFYEAVYQIKSEIGNFNLNEVVTYVAVSWILRSFYRTYISNTIGMKVRQGQIAMDLVKPINFIGYNLFYAVGKSFYRVLSIVLPLVMIFVFSDKIIPPKIEAFLMFLVVVILAFFIVYLIDFIIGVSAFFFDFNNGFVWTVESIIAFFAGLVVPLTFLPKSLLFIAESLPFQNLYFLPMQFFLGKIGEEIFVEVVVSEMIWVVTLFFLSRFLYSLGIRKLTIQGG